MDTELGLFWKARIEKMYAELGTVEVGFFSPDQEEKIAKGFEELKLAKEARREARISQSTNQLDETAEREQTQGSTNDLKKAQQ